MHRYFGVVAATVAVVAVCLVSASPSKTETPPKDLGRIVLSSELQRVHWMSMFEQGEQRKFAIELANHLAPTTVDYSWNARFIPLRSGIVAFEGEKPNKLEAAAISELKKAEPDRGSELWQHLPDGSWSLVTAVRTDPMCFHCHTDEAAAKADRNEPLGYASITLTKKIKD